MKCSEKGSVKSRSRRPRLFPLRPPETTSQTLYAEVPRSQIALYRFLFEGYDNLAILSVVDRYRAVIRLRYLTDADQTVRQLLASQGARIIERPAKPEQAALKRRTASSTKKTSPLVHADGRPFLSGDDS